MLALTALALVMVFCHLLARAAVFPAAWGMLYFSNEMVVACHVLINIYLR
jgi:hypothetical protein